MACCNRLADGNHLYRYSGTNKNSRWRPKISHTLIFELFLYVTYLTYAKLYPVLFYSLRAYSGYTG